LARDTVQWLCDSESGLDVSLDVLECFGFVWGKKNENGM